MEGKKGAREGIQQRKGKAIGYERQKQWLRVIMLQVLHE